MEKSETINLLFFGDTYLGGDLTPFWYKESNFNPFSELNELKKNADIIFTNLENTFYRGPLRPRRGGHLWAPPESITCLKKLGVDVVGLANNHSMDFGTDAMLRTKSLLKGNNIQCIGAGISLSNASKGTIIEKKGWKIGYLAYTTADFNVRSVEASFFSTGCAPINKSLICSDIKRLKASCDIICIVLHWGFEFVHLPDSTQRDLARELIKSGADVIIGSHPHVIQGFETIENKPIFYSLGNFIFPEYETLGGTIQPWSDVNNLSLAVNIEISKKSIGFGFEINTYPLRYRNNKVEQIIGDELLYIQQTLLTYNYAMIHSDSDLSIQAKKEISLRKRNWSRNKLFYKIRHIAKEILILLFGFYRIEKLKFRNREEHEN